MDSTAADRRKRKCLVALLIKNRVKTVEEAALVRHMFPASLDFSELAEAVYQSKIALTPKWEKKVNKIIESGWKPNDNPWMDFEDMRMEVLGSQVIAYSTSCIVYSPVEIWALMRRQSMSNEVHYMRSMLTDEEWYVKGKSAMLPASIHSDLTSNRSLTSGTINYSKTVEVFKKHAADVSPVSPLIQKILEKAKYE